MDVKKDVKRESLKNNFLKNIIVRFDYVGVSETELDGIIAEIKPIFKSDGYKNFKEENLTELDFQLEDPENINAIVGLPVKEIRKKKAYVFVNEDKGIECKLSTQFTLISIQSQKYIPFTDYSKTLIRVVKILKDKVEFLNFVRFGIRKINQCILKDISKLNQYFDEKFFSIYGLSRGIVPKLFENKNCFSEKEYDINLIRMVITGEYENELAYQVILDSDIYITNTDNIDELFDEEDNNKIETMNERLFELYKETLTSIFIKKLQKEYFDDSNIVGVEKNEGIYNGN